MMPHSFTSPLAHTYSIVARDPATGDMGVAVQSHWFSVGSLVTWAEAGVGAIATQAFVNASFGPHGLELLRLGLSAPEAVNTLIAADDGREVRQLAIVDSQGQVAAHTGRNCIPAAGHHLGDNYAVQANLMLNEQVWPAMAAAFESSRGPLAERLVATLAAAQAVGGDIRGQQSAALLVVSGVSTGEIWQDRLIELRIEDHPQPVTELQRLLQIHRAYEYMNRGDEAMERNDVAGALEAYRLAEALYSDNPEMKFWHAVSLANAGQVKAALPMFQEIFSQDRLWASLLARLPAVGLLRITPGDLATILNRSES
ncbi:MAG: DUF1028 domain-containing protein [Anaerolineae bacterium]